MKSNLPHLPKAVIKEIRDQFGFHGIDHYKKIDGKLEFVPENKHELDNLKEVFEKTYLKKIAENKSVKGFIEREIAWTKDRKETITRLEPYYYDLLVEWVSFLEFKKSTLKPSQATKEVNENETYENLYPLIFKNGYAFYLFLDLKSLTVKERTKVADYSFIFHKMKDKSIRAINESTTEPIFIKFLNDNFQADITAVKLPFKNPDYKQQTYNTLLNKYKTGILNEN